MPDERIQSSDAAARAAEMARDRLEKVIEEHPGTPWALLAKRELQRPVRLPLGRGHQAPAAQAEPQRREQAEPAERQQKRADPPKL